MGEKGPNSTASGNGWACRCVVLAAAGAPRPEKMLAGLHKRGASVRLVPDAACAMVELHQFQAQALIICQPDAIPAVPALRAAVAACHPRIACWRYDPSVNGSPERLAQLTSARKPMAKAPPRFAPAPPATPKISAENSRPAHAAGIAQHLVAPIVSADEMTQIPPLSAEELAMLLGGEFDEPQEETQQ